MRAALYARYSSDLQNDRSAGDQLAQLRGVVEARGWTEAGAWSDEAVSGASRAQRPGILALLAAAAERRFDVVVAESLSRVARDEEDSAWLRKRLAFHDVRLETVSQGAITGILGGIYGAVDADQLRQIAFATRRGQVARVQAGFSGGGRCYGYRPVRALDAAGEPVRGVLEVDAAEAAVIVRIFAAYAGGRSARALAHALNAEGVAGPRGGTWSPTTIMGDARAGDGVLCNPLYAGERVFNRRRFRKHPDTGRRSSVLNPPEMWVRVAAPELRIVEEGLWQAVQARRAAQVALGPPPAQRRPRRLLSGLLRCVLCAGPMTLHGGRYACAGHRERGTCPNGKVIAAATVERRVVEGVRARLLSPENVAHAVRAWREGAEAERRETLAGRAPMARELAEAGRRLERITEAYLSGAMPLAEYGDRKRPLDARRAELQAALAAAESPAAVQLHPEAASAYRALAEGLHAALEGDDAAEARDAFRALIDRVDFEPRPGKGDFALTVHGKLQALLGVTEESLLCRSGGCGSLIRSLPHNAAFTVAA